MNDKQQIPTFFNRSILSYYHQIRPCSPSDVLTIHVHKNGEHKPQSQLHIKRQISHSTIQTYA